MLQRLLSYVHWISLKLAPESCQLLHISDWKYSLHLHSFTSIYSSVKFSFLIQYNQYCCHNLPCSHYVVENVSWICLSSGYSWQECEALIIHKQSPLFSLADLKPLRFFFKSCHNHLHSAGRLWLSQTGETILQPAINLKHTKQSVPAL